MKGCRHDDIISKRGPHGEQHRRRDQKREESFFFLSIKSRRYEGPELVRDDRKGQEKGSEQRHLHFNKKGFIELGINQSPLAFPKSFRQRPYKEAENLVSKIEAQRERSEQCAHTPKKSEEHKTKLQSLMSISNAVFC